MNEKRLTPDDLAGFHGTDNYFKHSINPRIVYTDGVKYFAGKAGAYWFLDILATELEQVRKVEEFIVIELVVGEVTSACYIHCEDGDGNVLHKKDISYTDCPPGTWRFFMEPIRHVYGAESCIMLPSEH